MVWLYRMPATLFVMIYILCVVLCFAVGVMLTFHLWGVAKGETSVEGQDHEHYSKVAKSRGEVRGIIPFFVLDFLETDTIA